MIKISPSVLACDFSQFAAEIKKVEDAGVEYLHLDVMDGIFVPNITFGPCLISAVRPHSKLVFDTHLMITEPKRYIDEFAKAGADIITIHYESCSNHKETLEYIRSLGIKPAISIKPKTDPYLIKDLLPYVDMVLVMTVEPGFGGQSFIPETVDNIKAVKSMIDEAGLDVCIEVDGGISPKNVDVVVKAGATVIVAGSSVFKADDIALAVKQLREAAE